MQNCCPLPTAIEAPAELFKVSPDLAASKAETGSSAVTSQTAPMSMTQSACEPIVEKVRKAKSRETIAPSMITASKFESRRPLMLNHSVEGNFVRHTDFFNTIDAIADAAR